MNEHYVGEHLPGNETLNKDVPNRPYEVKYAERASERAPYRLELARLRSMASTRCASSTARRARSS